MSGNHQMVMDIDAKRPSGLDHLLRHIHIRDGWCWITPWMIVYQEYRPNGGCRAIAQSFCGLISDNAHFVYEPLVLELPDCFPQYF